MSITRRWSSRPPTSEGRPGLRLPRSSASHGARNCFSIWSNVPTLTPVSRLKAGLRRRRVAENGLDTRAAPSRRRSPMNQTSPWSGNPPGSAAATAVRCELSQQVYYLLPGVFADNPLPLVVNGQLWTVPYELLCYAGLTGLVVIGVVRHRQLSLWALAAMT